MLSQVSDNQLPPPDMTELSSSLQITQWHLMAAEDSEHHCGLCGKLFNRRDLRDRHKRRCLQSYNRPRKSRRKSCLACATSKLGCDLNLPSCSRCLSRNVPCNYTSTPEDAAAQDISASLPHDDGRQNESSFSNDIMTYPMSENMNSTSQFQLTMPEFTLPDGITSLDLNWNLGHVQNSQPLSSYDSTPYSLGDGSTMDWISPSLPDESPLTNDANIFELMASHGFQMWEPPAEPVDYFQPTRHTTRRRQDSATSPTFTAPASEQPMLAPPKRVRRSVTPPETQPRRPSPSSPKSLGSDKDLIQIVLDYVQMMLSRGTYPPYVHSRIYNCHKGDVLEPLAKAFCCIGALKASVPSSASFVLSLINAEREKLVRSFRDCGGSLIDTLACVHAMCVYQITGFFATSDEQEQNRSAELQHPLFLKMARKIAAQSPLTSTPSSPSSPSSSSSSSPDEDLESRWRTWILAETVRRTLLLVNLINVLSCRTRKQDPFFFEPLDDELILNMRIPAPETVWNASTAEAWGFAREALTEAEREVEGMTVGELDREVRKMREGKEIEDGERGMEEGRRKVLEGLGRGFVGLILATLKT